MKIFAPDHGQGIGDTGVISKVSALEQLTFHWESQAIMICIKDMTHAIKKTKTQK